MSEVFTHPPGLTAYLLLAAMLFCIGLYGVLTRKNSLAILISVELMANAVNINLVAFSRFSGDLLGQSFALFSIALTVAEVVIGIAIILLMVRTHKSIQADAPSSLRG
jgi:NADH-quinone oxidoreductase subunit K